MLSRHGNSARLALLLAGTALGGCWSNYVLAAAADRVDADRVDVGPIDITQSSAKAPADDTEGPGFFTGILKRSNLLGDMGGLRPLLGQYGITLILTDTSDVLGNISGGIDKGATYSALTTLTLQMDTQKAFGWEGGLVNVSGMQIRGRSLSQYYLTNLQTVSGIAAAPTTRLWEAWYQQSFLDGQYDVKMGMQSLDQDFMASKESAFYLNTMMGWPMVPSADLYAGGPAYPLSSLGVRFKAKPTGDITVLGGVFQDNPPGGPFNNDSQLRGSTRWGGNFNLRTGALFIAEVQYAVNQPSNGDMDTGGSPWNGLPGVYKLGAWFDTASFPNQVSDTMGMSLASPITTGMPRMNLYNASLYGLFDQTVWSAGSDGPQSIAVFARAMGAPNDRNLVSFSVNAGVNFHGMVPGRDTDTLAVGGGLAQVSSAARAFNRDTNFYGTAPFATPTRNVEQFIEITYQIQVTPWLQIQPDFQYIFNPGGGIPNSNNPELRVKNEAVFGARTGITF